MNKQPFEPYEFTLEREKLKSQRKKTAPQREHCSTNHKLIDISIRNSMQ